MKIELWQAFLMSAFFVALTGILYEYTNMQEKNAYNEGQLDAKEEQIEYFQGKDSNRYW